jgi:NADH dehydrogenase FAD-containing subunit
LEHEITFKNGKKRHYDIIIWTAGIKPNSLLEKLEVPKANGWRKADPYLRVEGMENVFAVAIRYHSKVKVFVLVRMRKRQNDKEK